MWLFRITTSWEKPPSGTTEIYVGALIPRYKKRKPDPFIAYYTHFHTQHHLIWIFHTSCLLFNILSCIVWPFPYFSTYSNLIQLLGIMARGGSSSGSSSSTSSSSSSSSSYRYRYNDDSVWSQKQRLRGYQFTEPIMAATIVLACIFLFALLILTVWWIGIRIRHQSRIFRWQGLGIALFSMLM